jgi:hypothetical protein
MPVGSPTNYTDRDVQKLNLMKERLSDLLSGVVVELELHSDLIDKVVVLQGILLALDSVSVPDVEQQPVFAEIREDIRRQVREYLQRELDKGEG